MCSTPHPAKHEHAGRRARNAARRLHPAEVLREEPASATTARSGGFAILVLPALARRILNAREDRCVVDRSHHWRVRIPVVRSAAGAAATRRAVAATTSAAAER